MKWFRKKKIWKINNQFYILRGSPVAVPNSTNKKRHNLSNWCPNYFYFYFADTSHTLYSSMKWFRKKKNMWKINNQFYSFRHATVVVPNSTNKKRHNLSNWCQNYIFFYFADTLHPLYSSMKWFRKKKICERSTINFTVLDVQPSWCRTQRTKTS